MIPWLTSGLPPRPDGVIDEQDLELLMQYLGTEIPEMPHPALIAHWRLDETEGTVAHDSPNIYGDAVYHAEVCGDPLWQPEGGIADGALQFDGVDDYVGTRFILDPAEGDFSVFAWIKGGAPNQVVVSQQNGVDWLTADAVLGALRTNLREPETTGRSPIPPGPPLICPIVVTDGDWHGVGFVRDGSDRILYVDDIEAAHDTATDLEFASGGLYIGAGKNLEPGSFLFGLIDEVRIYNQAVTP